MTAAAMAYYWFLAVFPALIAAVGFVGLLNVSPSVLEDLTGGVQAILPGDAGAVLTGALKNAEAQPQAASVIAALIGVAVAVWSASSAMANLQGTLDVACDVPSERSRKFVKKRLIAFGLIVATAVLGGLASALMVFGEPLGEALRDVLPFGEVFVPVWTALRLIGTILAIAISSQSSTIWAEPGIAPLAFSFSYRASAAPTARPTARSPGWCCSSSGSI
jgi:membrane protein